jgi:Ca-activated chloride channel family protein
VTVPSKAARTERVATRSAVPGRYNALSPGLIERLEWQFLRPELEVSLSIHIRKYLTSCCLLCAAAFALAVMPVATTGQDVAGAPPVFTTPKKQPPKPEKLPEDLGKIRVQSPLVSTPVTALEASGEFVYDLDENEFQIFDNGLPQKIERFEVSSDPIAAVIVIQTNEAVEPLLDHVRPLGSVFSALLLGERGHAAVILFDDKVRVAQEFSDSSDQFGRTLRGITARGDQERLNDALERAVALLGKRPESERRVIVAFSDGFDRGSESKTEEVVRHAANAGVTIYGLGFSPTEALLLQKPQPQPEDPLITNVARPLPPGMVPTPTNSENVWGTPIPGVPIMIAAGEIIRSALASSLLEMYAGYTGGVFYSHWSKKALQDQLNKIASEIHSQYELAYIPDDLTQEGFHRIEVRVQRPGVRIRARAGYFYEGGQ